MACFDLDSYLARVGHGGPREASLAVLSAIHLAHVGCIPFENLDVRLGRAVTLDLEALQDKLVRRRRGGYCFEQNTLFAAALTDLGFTVTTLEARVRPPGATRVLPRTHMVLSVDLGGRSYLADVGFGGDGLLRPLALDGEPNEQGGAIYAVAPGPGDELVLRRHGRGGSLDLYAFTRRPALAVDYEVANHYTSTHPASRFVQMLTVQRSTEAVRYILRDRTYLERRGDDEVVTALADPEVVRAVRDVMGLDVSAEEIVRALPTTP